ncbi:hypothetical protein [Streptomyces viridosporus]|nr:hypothetical protein [Streptomyces viridosporus]
MAVAAVVFVVLTASGDDDSPDREPTGSSTDTGGLPDLPPGVPSELPSDLPSRLPSGFPTELPSGFPTELPSGLESLLPSLGDAGAP